MADHGDDVAEFVLNRSFNQYNAREALRFILNSSKQRHNALNNGNNSKELGKHTLDFISTNDLVHSLEGFEVEKFSSFELAALKAYVLKEEYGIEVAQVKESLLMRTEDYAKISSDSMTKEINKKIYDVSNNSVLRQEIYTRAKIEDQNIERELFLKLPYANESLSTKERITKRNIEASKAKIKDATTKPFQRELAQNIAK